MNLLQNIFSVKNYGNHKVLTILGFKIKWFNTKKVAKNMIAHNIQPEKFLFNYMKSLWYENGSTDEFFTYSRLLCHSPYLWKIMDYKFWLFVLSAFIENQLESDADEILQTYLYFYNTEGLSNYFLTAKYAKAKGIENGEINKACFVYDKFYDTQIFENFSNNIKNKSIAIVGGSGRELGKGKGKEIDEHDFVIRFNNYPEDNTFINDYGSKTNIWVRQTSLDTRHREDISKYKYVIWADNNNSLYLRPQHLDIMYNYFINNESKIISIHHNYFREFTEKTKIYHPTTGAIVIYMLNSILGNLNNVDVYGFAFLDNNVNDLNHYFDDLCKISTCHYFDMEVPFLSRFYKNCKRTTENDYFNT